MPSFPHVQGTSSQKQWTFTNNMNMRDLSRDDDFLSHMLIETLGTGDMPLVVHKMDPSRRFPQVDPQGVLSIVQKWLLHSKITPPKRIRGAVDGMLRLPPVRQYLRHMSSSQINAFATHAARYLEVYLPQASTEIAQTSRYSHHTGKAELCILATQPLPVGTVIAELKGSMAVLSDQENEELKRTGRNAQGARRDFSVIHSGHRKKNHLFLGPARFVNHDCDNNCDLVREGKYITFRVIKPIAMGQEITAHYGDSYFGKGNRHCLCESCESLGRGGYREDPYTDSDHDSDSDVSVVSAVDRRPKSPRAAELVGNASERRTRRGVYRTVSSNDSGDDQNSELAGGEELCIPIGDLKPKEEELEEENVIQIADLHGPILPSSTLTPISQSPSSSVLDCLSPSTTFSPSTGVEPLSPRSFSSSGCNSGGHSIASNSIGRSNNSDPFLTTLDELADSCATAQSASHSERDQMPISGAGSFIGSPLSEHRLPSIKSSPSGSPARSSSMSNSDRLRPSPPSSTAQTEELSRVTRRSPPTPRLCSTLISPSNLLTPASEKYRASPATRSSYLAAKLMQNAEVSHQGAVKRPLRTTRNTERLSSQARHPSGQQTPNTFLDRCQANFETGVLKGDGATSDDDQPRRSNRLGAEAKKSASSNSPFLSKTLKGRVGMRPDAAAPRKRGRPPKQPKRCSCCEVVLSASEAGRRNPLGLLECYRCTRHSTIFGAPWPSRVPLISALPSPTPELTSDPQLQRKPGRRPHDTESGRPSKRRRIQTEEKEPAVSNSVRRNGSGTSDRLNKVELRRIRKNERRRLARAKARSERVAAATVPRRRGRPRKHPLPELEESTSSSASDMTTSEEDSEPESAISLVGLLQSWPDHESSGVISGARSRRFRSRHSSSSYGMQRCPQTLAAKLWSRLEGADETASCSSDSVEIVEDYFGAMVEADRMEDACTGPPGCWDVRPSAFARRRSTGTDIPIAVESIGQIVEIHQEPAVEARIDLRFTYLSTTQTTQSGPRVALRKPRIQTSLPVAISTQLWSTGTEGESPLMGPGQKMTDNSDTFFDANEDRLPLDSSPCKLTFLQPPKTATLPVFTPSWSFHSPFQFEDAIAAPSISKRRDVSEKCRVSEIKLDLSPASPAPLAVSSWRFPLRTMQAAEVAETTNTEGRIPDRSAEEDRTAQSAAQYTSRIDHGRIPIGDDIGRCDFRHVPTQVPLILNSKAMESIFKTPDVSPLHDMVEIELRHVQWEWESERMMTSEQEQNEG